MGKTIVVILTFGLSILISYLLSLKHVKLHNFYLDFFTFNNCYENQLSYSKNTLPSIIENFNNRDSDFIELLRRYMDNREVVNLSYLKDEDYLLINEYVSTLGKTDEYSQKQFIQNYKGIISKNLENSEVSKKRYCALYIKLGFFIGLTLVILIL